MPSVASATSEARPTGRQERPVRVLWADDKPDNNEHERAALGVTFDLALSTEQALPMMRAGRCDLVTSDMGRPGDPQAGCTLLRAVRERGDATRYLLYTSSCTETHMLEARTGGALGCSTQILQTMQMAIAALEARP